MIRRAKENDIPQIIALLRQVLEVHHNLRPDLFRTGSTKYSRQELRDIIANPDKPIFVYVDGTATSQDRILGYAFTAIQRHHGDNIITDITTLYIDDICVDADTRGQHVATRLYRHCVDFARANHFHNVTLNVWEGNDAALAFYRAMGMGVQKTCMEQVL